MKLHATDVTVKPYSKNTTEVEFEPDSIEEILKQIEDYEIVDYGLRSIGIDSFIEDCSPESVLNILKIADIKQFLVDNNETLD